MGIREITVSKFALIILLFLMPFVAVSCDGKPVMKLSGTELVSGKSIETKMPFTGKTEVEEIQPEPYAIAALAASSLGLLLLLIKGRVSAISSVICGFGGFVSLLLLKFKMEADALKQGQGLFTADVQFAFWLSLLLFAAITVVNGYALSRPAAERSVVGSEKKSTFHFWYGGGVSIMAVVFVMLGLNYSNRPAIAAPQSQAAAQQPSHVSAYAGANHSLSNAAQVSTADISGNWQGTYESQGHPPTPFSMTFGNFNNGTFDGSASEQIVSAGAAETIQSKLTGAANSVSVTFMKEFSFKGKSYSVMYNGIYDPITKRIQGNWKGMTNNSHGSFLVWR